MLNSTSGDLLLPYITLSRLGPVLHVFFDNVHGHIYDFTWRSDRKFNVKLGKLATETVEMLKQDYGHEAKGKVM